MHSCLPGWNDDTLSEGPGLSNGAGRVVSLGNGDNQAVGYGWPTAISRGDYLYSYSTGDDR